jgi:hypothetical protein
MLIKALLVPLGGLLIGAGVFIGGRPGQILAAIGTILFGVATVLVLATA